MNKAIQWFALGLIAGVIFAFAACSPVTAYQPTCQRLKSEPQMAYSKP